MAVTERPLGRTGLRVSEIGFGAWAIGDAWGDLVPEEQAKAALRAALDAGVTFIDTADVYGAGRSERLIGEVLRERRAAGGGSDVRVATKMGRGPGWSDTLPSIREAAARACERLGVDALDLVQLHCIPGKTLRAGRAFEHLETVRSDGLIRWWGVSVETIDEGLFCIRESPAAALQVIFNIFRQRVADELLPAANDAGVGIIARVPLASGLLTGKFSEQTEFPESDHRRFNADGQQFNVGETFAGVPFRDGVSLAREVKGILEDDPAAASGSPSLAQLSLRWILDHPAVSTVIPGAKSPEQARENTAASSLPPLSPETRRRLRDLYADKINTAVRGAY